MPNDHDERRLLYVQEQEHLLDEAVALDRCEALVAQVGVLLEQVEITRKKAKAHRKAAKKIRKILGDYAPSDLIPIEEPDVPEPT